MPSINLAPGTQYIITARKRRVRLYTIAIAVIAVFLLGWLGLYMYVRFLTTTSNNVKVNIENVNQDIQALRDDAIRVSLFEKRLSDVSQILDKHIGWDNVLSDLERLLPADTALTSFEATSGNSTITVQGTTANVDQIALALASLTAGVNHPSVFSKGTVNSIQRQEISAGEGNPATVLYAFTMTLEFATASLNKTAL